MKFQKTRFHIDFGPPSLFSRILFKMADVTEIKMHGKHFSARCAERNIPDNVLEKIKNFSCKEWSLKTCEVRNDRDWHQQRRPVKNVEAPEFMVLV